MLQVGDFNTDGKLDLAVSSQATNTLSILLGQGNETFAIGSVTQILSSPEGMIEADINQDGNADFFLSDLAIRPVTRPPIPSDSSTVLVQNESGEPD